MPSVSSTESDEGEAPVAQQSDVSQQNDVPPLLEEHPSPLRRLCTPVLRTLLGEKTQRTMVKTVLILFASASILLASIAAYIIFYSSHIPAVTHVEPVWLQYTGNAAPSSVVDLTHGGVLTTVNVHTEKGSMALTSFG